MSETPKDRLARVKVDLQERPAVGWEGVFDRYMAAIGNELNALQEQNRRLRSNLEYHKAKHQWPGQTLTELPTGQWVPHPSNDFRGQEPPDA